MNDNSGRSDMVTRQMRLDGSVTPTTLVNVTKDDHPTPDKRIGRSSKYGSPFKLKKDGGNYTREESVKEFKDYWYSEENADLRKVALEELPRLIIGCYCVEEPKTEVEGVPCVCHGEVILEFLNDHE